MRSIRLLTFAVAIISARRVGAADVEISTPMPPPAWALLERELIEAQTTACREFFDRYFDDRGWLECVERWGGDDGPDDAIENVNDWPILHALGASDDVLTLYKKAWEGHLRQFTLAKTTEVEFARDGMYYKEFPVKFDWLHNGEGLTVFNLQGLSDPGDLRFRQRVRRFAGFYMNDDPGAANYDPQHKIIRSLFNGSRGPLLRKATAVDWAGDPIEVENRFKPGHGENSYAQMLEHFRDYNDIVGDHPQNLLATSLGLNAYMLTGEDRYRDWVLEYVNAWRERALANGGILPTNIGLDGSIGGECGGRWYGGVYGWGFSVHDPASNAIANRNTHYLGLTGFGNALLLTGDQRYTDLWRGQIEAVNAHGKMIDGIMQYPSMHGDDGWYAYSPAPYSHGALDVYYWSMDSADRTRVGGNGWLAWLEGQNPDYPVAALQRDFALLRQKIQDRQEDATTPDTRLSDDPMRINPANVETLIQLMLGGLHPRHQGAVLHCRLRYFDPAGRRAGLPADVGALVHTLTDDTTGVTLVNLNQSESRTVTVQMGGYGEHQCLRADANGKTVDVDQSHFSVHLAPGAGGRLELALKRYANQPSMLPPWERP